MHLPKLAIRNAQFTLVLVLIAVIISLQSFLKMPRSEDPHLILPYFSIVVIFPGTSPDDMEQLIVDPIEAVLEDLENIDEIKSKIEEGITSINIRASFDIDADEKFDEIVREVATVRDRLPNGIVFFDVFPYKSNDRTSIKQYALISETISFAKLTDYAEQFEKELKALDDIKTISLDGHPDEEIRISLDFQRIANQQISLQQVIAVLQSNNINIPGGSVRAQDKTLSIKTTGGYKTLEEIRKTVIAGAGGNLIYLQDIAKVEMDYEDRRWLARFNKKNALWLSVKVKEGANILNVAEEIKTIEQKFKSSLPPNVDLEIAFEQAPAIKKRIEDFFMNLLQGVLLVGAVILLFLGWRSAVIIITIIPLCIIFTLAILNGAGFAIQQISIASLIVALGLLVDNGIVVVENINRYLKEGLSLKEAAMVGTAEVGYPIISSTATTILAFFPLSQMGGGAGVFFKSLPITILLTLTISLALSLTLSPIMASKILRQSAAARASWMDRLLDWFTKKVYRRVLNFSLRYSWLIMIFAVLIFTFSVSLFPKIGISFFPTADKSLLLIDIETPEGTNIYTTDKAVSFVENVLDTIDYVQSFGANTGHGNPQVYYNRVPVNYKSNYGQIMVNFKTWNPAKFYQTLGQLRRAFDQYPGAKITFSELKNGASRDAPIEFFIMGEESAVLKDIAAQVEAIFNSTPGIINIKNPLSVDKTELTINLNKERAGLVNLSPLHFDQTIRASLSGLRIGEVSLEGDDKYPMIVRMSFDDNEAPNISDFNKVYFATPLSSQLPLRQIADIGFRSSSPQIGHFNLDRHTRILGDVVEADQAIPLTNFLIDTLATLELPAGYSIIAKGEYEDQKKTFGDLGTILILAQVGIFAILVLQFRSILQPLAVFSAIPFAICGSFVALYLSGWPFSFNAFLGLISLVGIVVNNSIIIVDYINRMRADGMARIEAIKAGSERRLIPVILTTITTILGLVPLTASCSNLWTPLGWTIIGGMISSTLMTLVVVPVLYKWFTRG